MVRHWQSVSAATLRRLVFCLWQTRAPAVRPVWNARRTSLMRQFFSSMSAALILSFCSSLPLTSSHGQCIFVHIPALPHWHSVFCPRPLPAFCPAFCFWQPVRLARSRSPQGASLAVFFRLCPLYPHFAVLIYLSFVSLPLTSSRWQFIFLLILVLPHWPSVFCTSSFCPSLPLASQSARCGTPEGRHLPLALCILSTSTSSTFVFVFFSFALCGVN